MNVTNITKFLKVACSSRSIVGYSGARVEQYEIVSFFAAMLRTLRNENRVETCVELSYDKVAPAPGGLTAATHGLSNLNKMRPRAPEGGQC